jgi:hypothetical protein
MKKIFVLGTIGLIFLLYGLCMAQAPHQVGGFALGRQIADYPDAVGLDTKLALRYMEYVEEVETKEIEGFKSGLIWYGKCAFPGRIVRIKLKYADSTKIFYEKLLELFKERFGEPTEWRGDPFRVVLAWKWAFTDSESNQISLILQHNMDFEGETKGNYVKLTCWDFIEEERACFEKKHPGPREVREQKKHGQVRHGPVNWDQLMPR